MVTKPNAGKKIGGQGGDISGWLVFEAAYDVDQHRCDCGQEATAS
jgi:hypothetical protein